jgi:hypothetical protein
VERTLLVAPKVLREVIERSGSLMPQAMDRLEPDQVGVFARDVLSGRDCDVSQAPP